MATHSNILAWEIPWSEELGGLQSIELQRVRVHARAHTHTRTCTHMHARKQFRSHPLPSLYLSPTTKLIKYASEYEKIRKIFDRQAFSPILSLA